MSKPISIQYLPSILESLSDTKFMILMSIYILTQNRNSTYFIKCADLMETLHKAQLEGRLQERLKKFTGYKLLIIDELGYLPITRDDSKLFFQLIDRRYERNSTIVTTNINFSQWDDIFGDPLIAGAIVDRLLHHATVVTIKGKSYRLQNFYRAEEESL